MFKIQWPYCCARSKIRKIPRQLARTGSRIPRIQQNIFCQRSKIPRIPRQYCRGGIQDLRIPLENENIRFKIPDPGSWGSRISDFFGILAHVCSKVAVLALCSKTICKFDQKCAVGCSESYRVKFQLVKSHDACSVFCSMYQIKAWVKVSLILKHI